MFSLSVSVFFQSNTASKRRVQIHDTRPVKPELALVYLEYLLTHPKNRECLLSAPRKKLNHLLKALETSKVTLCPESWVVFYDNGGDKSRCEGFIFPVLYKCSGCNRIGSDHVTSFSWYKAWSLAGARLGVKSQLTCVQKSCISVAPARALGLRRMARVSQNTPSAGDMSHTLSCEHSVPAVLGSFFWECLENISWEPIIFPTVPRRPSSLPLLQKPALWTPCYIALKCHCTRSKASAEQSQADGEDGPGHEAGRGRVVLCAGQGLWTVSWGRSPGCTFSHATQHLTSRRRVLGDWASPERGSFQLAWDQVLPIVLAVWGVVMPCQSACGPWVFSVPGRFGVTSADTGWEASWLRWSGCPASLWPPLSAEHPSSTQGAPVPGPLLGWYAALFLLLIYLLVFGQFCSEGKVYLSILEDTGFWLESKILSFIQDQEEDSLKLHRVIYQQIIQVRSLKTQKPFSLPSLLCFSISFSTLEW